MPSYASAAFLFALGASSAVAQNSLCDAPDLFCGKLVSAECLSRVGAGAIAIEELDPTEAKGDCKKQLESYRECVRASGNCPSAPSHSTGSESCSDATALALWTEAAADNDCLGYSSFRDACPNSPQAKFAASRMRRLGCGLQRKSGLGESATDESANQETSTRKARMIEPAASDASSDSEDEYERDLYRRIQTELQRLLYYSGPIDGLWGNGSKDALRGFQIHSEISPADGIPSKDVLSILSIATAPQSSIGRPPKVTIEEPAPEKPTVAPSESAQKSSLATIQGDWKARCDTRDVTNLRATVDGLEVSFRFFYATDWGRKIQRGQVAIDMDLKVSGNWTCSGGGGCYVRPISGVFPNLNFEEFTCRLIS